MDLSNLLLVLSLSKFEISQEGEDIDENFSNIFIDKDYKKVRYYLWDPEELVIKCKWQYGYETTLSKIKQRLDLIGYSIMEAKKRYEDYVKSYPGDTSNFYSFNDLYNEYINLNVIKSDVVETIRKNEYGGPFCDWDFGEFYSKVISPSEVFYKETKYNDLSKILSLNLDKVESNLISDEEFYAQIDPLIKLSILARNPKNLNLKVTWRSIDSFNFKLLSKDDVQKSKNFEKILIATEGRTDAYILRKSLDLLFPEIADIFYFLDYSQTDDMNISGCKELAKFCKSISQLKHGKVIALFDNDGDGVEAYNEAKKVVSSDPNLLITKLPILDSMKNIVEKDPWDNSKKEVDINGKAVAIESFLDLSLLKKTIKIDWERGKHRQGKLKYKKKYQQIFKTFAESRRLKKGKYDTSKLEYLINYLIKEWIKHVNKFI